MAYGDGNRSNNRGNMMNRSTNNSAQQRQSRRNRAQRPTRNNPRMMRNVPGTGTGNNPMIDYCCTSNACSDPACVNSICCSGMSSDRGRTNLRGGGPGGGMNMNTRRVGSQMVGCPPGYHSMGMNAQGQQTCMEGAYHGASSSYNRRTSSHNSHNSQNRPLRINNARDIRQMTNRPKRVISNTKDLNYAFGNGNGNGGGTRHGCPPFCPTGQCCIPAHTTYGEIVDGRAMGGVTYHPPSCGTCGGGGTGDRSR